MNAVQTYTNKLTDASLVTHVLNSTSYLLTKRAVANSAEYNELKFEVGNISHYAKAIDVRASFVGSAASSLAMMTYHVLATVVLLFAGLAVLVCNNNETILDLAVKQFVQVGANIGFGSVSIMGVFSPSLAAQFITEVDKQLDQLAPVQAATASASEAGRGLGNLFSTAFRIGKNIANNIHHN